MTNEEDFGYLVRNEQRKPRVMFYVQETGNVYMARCGVVFRIGFEPTREGYIVAHEAEPKVEIEQIGAIGNVEKITDTCKKEGLDLIIAPTVKDVRGAALAHALGFAMKYGTLEKLAEVHDREMKPLYGVRP